MSKMTVKIGGKTVKLDLGKKRVQDAVANLIEAATVREFPIGMTLEHANGSDYVLSRIKQWDGSYRAYLINHDTGIARNSRKVVKVEEPTSGGVGRGYVTDLPAEKDRFYDPDGSGDFIDC